MSQATFKINNINIVSTWNYTCKNTSCVCDRSLHLPTSAEVEKKNIYRNDIIFGECGHGMHSECINLYIKNNEGMCPIDRLPWIPVKTNSKIKYSMLK